MSNVNDFKECPNCGKKDSMWNGKLIFLTQKEIDFINKHHETKSIAYCDDDNCGGTLISLLKGNLITQFNEIDFDLIPVITLPNPQGWEYIILDLVNAQTTTGTGAITEIFAQVADFMGEQSERHNNKIQTAINSCKNQLRKQALSQGGNAVIGCNIDITTGGSGNGLIIICMSGTSIFIEDLSIFNESIQEGINKIIELHNEIVDLIN